MAYRGPLFASSDGNRGRPEYATLVVGLAAVLITLVGVFDQWNKLPAWAAIGIGSFILATCLLVGWTIAGDTFVRISRAIRTQYAIIVYRSEIRSLSTEMARNTSLDFNDTLPGLFNSLHNWTNGSAISNSLETAHLQSLFQWVAAIQTRLQHQPPTREDLREMGEVLDRICSLCASKGNELNRHIEKGMALSGSIPALKQEWFRRREKLNEFLQRWTRFARSFNKTSPPDTSSPSICREQLTDIPLIH